jgi:tetratricopeptide (TPR) repeat protein
MKLNIIKTAEAAFHCGNFREAARLYQSAVDESRIKQDLVAEAEQKNNLSVSLLQAGDAEGALAATKDTDKIFAGINDQKRQAIALGNTAAALEALGKLDEALQIYIQASEILKAMHETELRSYILKNIAALQLRTGGQLQAIASMQAALDNQGKLSLRQRILKKLVDIPFNMWR